MRRQIFIFLILFFIVSFCNAVHAQKSSDSLVNEQMTFDLKNDTLYSNTGLKFFVGQQLAIGNAAGDEGRYRSIISGKAAIVPSIWGQDKRYEYAIENYVDTKKNKEKVKSSLVPGNLLSIKGMALSKTGKPHFYMVILTSDSERYQCDIKLALIQKELLLKQ